MEDNLYDNESFFESYRSLHCRASSAKTFFEIEDLHRSLPNLSGKNILDLGCGFGNFLRFAKNNGANTCVGIDKSMRMIAEAKSLSRYYDISYVVADIRQFSTSSSFDLCFSSLALHYVDDIASVLHRVFQTLTDGGRFVFSVEHPISSAQQTGWSRTVKPDCWGVEGYLTVGPRTFEWFGNEVTKYHRPIASWFGALRDAGFFVDDIIEPTPSESISSLRTELGISSDRPAFVIFSAVKNC